MNLFVVLIPFLLMSAAFFHVAVIPTSLPSHGASEGGEEADDAGRVTVNLYVAEAAISVSATSPSLDEEALEQLSHTILSDGGAYDLDRLGAVLADIKADYDRSDTVVVLPEAEVSYRDVVRVLDAAREVTRGGSTVPLFPVVVLSRKL